MLTAIPPNIHLSKASLIGFFEQDGSLQARENSKFSYGAEYSGTSTKANKRDYNGALDEARA
jgi:hypothetical protein